MKGKMNEKDKQLIRTFLLTQEKAISNLYEELAAIKEALEETVPEFHEVLLKKFEDRLRESKNTSDGFDSSKTSAIDQIVQILEKLD